MPDDAEVYQRLHHAITEGRYLPGVRLVEAELQESLGASRAQVRTALFLLEHDGLVERVRNRGASVRAISEAEAREIIDARSALEGLAAGRAAGNATDAQIAVLRTLVSDMRAALDRDDLAAASEFNSRIHDGVLQAAGSGTLRRIVGGLNNSLVRFRFQTIFAVDRSEHSFEEHRDIVEAIAAHDPARAENAMRHHLGNVAATLHARALGEH